MKRRCGNCFFAKGSGEFVLCWGAPPAVTGRVVDAEGKEMVTTTPPVLHPNRPPCALHLYRFTPSRTIWRRLTSAA
jgi:hypothetical protein